MIFLLSRSAKLVARASCRCRSWSQNVSLKSTSQPLKPTEFSNPTENQLRHINYFSRIVAIRPCQSLTIWNAQQIRWRYSKKKSQEDDDDLDEEDDFDSGKDDAVSKVVTGHMTSLRADLVLKTGLGIARNKIETLFYESKIRVNGGKINKKSQRVNVGDEVDVIKGASPINPCLTVVSRVVVLSVKEHEDGDKLSVKMRRYKSLNIENTDTYGAI